MVPFITSSRLRDGKIKYLVFGLLNLLPNHSSKGTSHPNLWKCIVWKLNPWFLNERFCPRGKGILQRMRLRRDPSVIKHAERFIWKIIFPSAEDIWRRVELYSYEKWKGECNTAPVSTAVQGRFGNVGMAGNFTNEPPPFRFCILPASGRLCGRHHFRRCGKRHPHHPDSSPALEVLSVY